MTAGCEGRYAPEVCAENFGDLKKKKVRESSSIVGRRRLAFGARRGLATGAHAV